LSPQIKKEKLMIINYAFLPGNRKEGILNLTMIPPKVIEEEFKPQGKIKEKKLIVF